MKELIERRFKKIAEGRYIYTKRQLAYAIIGGIGFLGMLYGYLYVASDTILFTISGGICLLFIALGLYTVTSEIDLKKRKAIITRRTTWGQKSSNEFSLDRIRVTALRIGVTDANPHDVWIAKAGIDSITHDGGSYNVAIFSRETESIEERSSVMIELYHFFYPDRKSVGPGHIITNGSLAEVLSDAEKIAWENENATTFEVKGGGG
jgi:hypothetical protein